MKIYLIPVATMVTAIALIVPQPWYVVSLWQNFAFHALWLYLVLAVGALLFRKKILAQAAGLSFVMILAYLWPYLVRPSSSSVDGADLKVTHFNVLKYSSAYDKTIKQALKSQADFLSFQEVDPAWVKELEFALTKAYPYQKVVIDNNPGYGIAVFSKYPLKQLEVKYWTGIPSITGDIWLADHTIHFVTAHTKSPVSRSRFVARNHHLTAMASYLENRKGPVLAVGDFNAVPWDSAIVALRQKADLQDSRSGLEPTFPAFSKWGRIPIDYIMHNEQLTCLNFQTIGGTDSDHLGITGAYKFRD
ncbi:MAG: endonuclease/exonuclease/phosphatase family protein [Cyclobacteriaceae bacterium]